MPNILSPVKNSFYNLDTIETLLILQLSNPRIRKFSMISKEVFLLLRFLFNFWLGDHHFGLVQIAIVSLWKLNLFGTVQIGESEYFWIFILITHLINMILYCYRCGKDVYVCKFNLFQLFKPSFYRIFYCWWKHKF